MFNRRKHTGDGHRDGGGARGKRLLPLVFVTLNFKRLLNDYWSDSTHLIVKVFEKEEKENTFSFEI